MISRIGQALYGPVQWRWRLADDLGVSSRTLRRWELGEKPVPDGVWGECAELLRQHGPVRLAELIAEVERLSRTPE